MNSVKWIDVLSFDEKSPIEQVESTKERFTVASTVYIRVYASLSIFHLLSLSLSLFLSLSHALCLSHTQSIFIDFMSA